MKLIEQSAKIIGMDHEEAIRQMKMIEYAGRNCYASQRKITDNSYEGFIENLIKRGHESPLEFGFMKAELVTSRAVLAEITRHRLASFCVESQRYINEAGEGGIEFIKPWWFDNCSNNVKNVFIGSLVSAEQAYVYLIENGLLNQEARGVLPNATACKIEIAANLREWRHIFTLRCSPAAYPEISILMKKLLRDASDLMPCVFGDLL